MGSTGQLSRRLAEEDGFGLIEVMAAAALLLVVAIATLGVFDAAAKTSGQSKARTIAAALAEQDQERMRAMKAADLSNHHATKRVDASGVVAADGAYTVDSRVDWVRDAGGVESCTSSSTQAEYLRITSTVRSDGLGAGKSVSTSSLVAPPVDSFGSNLGTLTIKVVNRDNQPVPGVDVAISGPTSLSDTTNSLGCAVFSHIPVGTYAGTTNRADYVDWDGDRPGDVSGVVNAGTVTTVAANFDLAATAKASFLTYVNPFAGYTGPTGWQSSQAQSVTASGPKGTRVFKTGAWQQEIQAPDLFPFVEGYGVYSGSCASADPTKYDAAFFTTYKTAFATTDPNGKPVVTVRQPPVAVRVVSATGQALKNAKVVATATGTGCAADKFADLTTDANGFVTHPGAAFDPGLPFGSYTLCASAPSSVTGRYLLATLAYANTSFQPTVATALALPTDIATNQKTAPCS